MSRSPFRALICMLACGVLIGPARSQDAEMPQVENEGLRVWVPESTLEVNATLLYLQPGSGALQYGTLINPLPVPTPYWQNQAVRPGFSPAFNVGLKYGSDWGGDIQLNWTHLNAGGGSAMAAVGGEMVGPPYEIGPGSAVFTSATANANFNFDAINLDVGLQARFGPHIQVRPFAGLQGTSINQNLTATFLNATQSVSHTYASKSEFGGVGPRMGMDVQYTAGRFGLVGGIAGMALAGSMQSRIDWATSSPLVVAAGITPPNSQFLTSPTITTIIPGIDTKLGASYAIPVGKRGTLKCEAGYQAVAYVNAISQYSVTEVVTPPFAATTVGVYLRSESVTQSNFYAHGPYLNFALQY